MENGDAVGDREGLLLVVSHVDGRDAELELDAADLLAQLDPHLRVERRERLVEQEDARLDRERPSERDALLHPARELVRVALASMAEPDELEQLLRSSLRRSDFDLPRIRRPYSTFCAAVMFGKRLYAWKTIPMSRLFGGTLVRSRPSTTIRPASARSKPATRRRAVVLPHPLGPRSETNSPCLEREVDALQRDDRPEGAVQALELEVRHAAYLPTPTRTVRCPPRRPMRSSESIAAQVIAKLISVTAAAG